MLTDSPKCFIERKRICKEEKVRYGREKEKKKFSKFKIEMSKKPTSKRSIYLMKKGLNHEDKCDDEECFWKLDLN